MEVKNFLITKEVFETDSASSKTHKTTLKFYKNRLIVDGA